MSANRDGNVKLSSIHLAIMVALAEKPRPTRELWSDGAVGNINSAYRCIRDLRLAGYVVVVGRRSGKDPANIRGLTDKGREALASEAERNER